MSVFMGVSKVLELKSIRKTSGNNVEVLRRSEMSEETLKEYEQRIQQEVRDSAMLRPPTQSCSRGNCCQTC
jgi:hypothetical protein